MHDIKEQHLKSVFTLWTNWLIASGALILTTVMGLWISCTWLPLVAFGLETCLYMITRYQSEENFAPCSLTLFIATRSLFWSGLTMVGINLLFSYRIVHRLFDPELLNTSIPYIPILVIGPITTATAFFAYIRGGKFIFCRLCQQNHGMLHERGFLGKTFNQESHYQTSLLINLFTLITVVTWIYYLVKYINVNLNSADTFMFVWCPVIIWILAGLHIGIRYSAFWNYYDQNLAGSSQQTGLHTRMRLILVQGDSIYLQLPTKDSPDLIPEDRKIDTPCHLHFRYYPEMPFELALKSFENMVMFENLDMRFLYSNTNGNPDFTMFHYAAFITDEQKPLVEKRYPDGEWVPIREVQSLLNNGCLSPFLSAEIIRIHTIAMAWKTYDINGNRRFKIKHYHPTFHLEEMKEWDVDYNDPKWLFVSINNADTPFWRLRRFWYKHILGVRK